MNIRWKATLSIAVVFAALCAAEIIVAQGVLLPSFAQLERSEADTAMRRIENGVALTLEYLAVSATGWGNWTDVYRFAQDHNHSFVDENITEIGLKQLNVNALIILDVDGRFLTSGTIDLVSGAPLNLDLVAAGQLPAGFPWRANLQTGLPVRGFIQTNQGILMMAAAPILDGFGHGPVRGMVILGRLLSPAEIQRIALQAQAMLSMLPPGKARDSPSIQTSDDHLTIAQPFRDLYGQIAFTLQVDLPREITRRGASAVRYASLCLIGAVVIVLVLLVVMLDRLVLNPVGRITRHAVAIGADKDLTTRLDFAGTDEIGILAREIDRMVARVAESRSQLVDQAFHAGFAELAKGVLHNLGNAMTPIGVRLSMLHSRLRAAPLDDAELAVAELGAEHLEPQRRSGLEEFLRLACGQFAAAIRASEEDVEVMSRQTAIVQSALAEQMRATRNEHVIETIRLHELLAQTLEVVPDSARQQLVIEADRSLHDIGVVNIPRTVLRLILQNFIINAADSTRELARARGSFRIAAELRVQGDREHLYLHCTDDGVGIAPEHLERVFEKGFSTKSRETNFGIGLHWCANAIAALGGRVWATSEGVGRGATLHVMVPLATRAGVAIVKAA